MHLLKRYSDVSCAVLLHALGPRRYLLVLTALLSERRVIMVASALRKLTACVHGALAALHPLQWQHIFVPLLPSALLSYACAPYPFLIGLHRNHLPALLDPDSDLALSEVLVVDLDTSALHVAGALHADSPPLLHDVVGGGLLTAHTRAVRRGADSLDHLRVRAAKYLATKLETYTPADVASRVETFAERALDAGQSLAERLHAVASAHSGKTAAWRMAHAQEGGPLDDANAEAAPAWDAAGAYGEGVGPARGPAAANGKAAASSLYGLGPDDRALSEALLTFFLQLIGDPEPFAQVARGLDERHGRLLSPVLALGSSCLCLLSAAFAARRECREPRRSGRGDGPCARAVPFVAGRGTAVPGLRRLACAHGLLGGVCADPNVPGKVLNRGVTPQSATF
jgi:hypothetical protein